MKKHLIFLALLICTEIQAKIDRQVVVTRNNPHITQIDTLASLTVGNGEFAFTADVTGLQTLHQLYRKGVPLGTMAQWGWHSFPNAGSYKPQDVLRSFDFGRGSEEWYSCQLKDEKGKAASDYLRANPHRLHLGIVGFAGMKAKDLSNINQTLDLWNGILQSEYSCKGRPMQVQTWCHPQRDMVMATINDPSMHSIELRFPYPTGQHSDDACNWAEGLPHNVEAVSTGKHTAVYRHVLDGQAYYIRLTWQNANEPKIKNGIISISPAGKLWSIGVEFTKDAPKSPSEVLHANATRTYWNAFWSKGGIVDFSKCKDPRAKELERRVVLSQYLLAVQCAGSTPPQETGLTYNSWFGKFHLEMIWWHQAHFALWGHPELLARTLPWYRKALPMAREIANRQGFEGARWMKMTDPSGAEAPSNVGSFLIWQQPHLIYLCELMYRATKDKKVISEYASLVDETARFMASFATYNKSLNRYELRGCIPAQETLKASETVNPPFELSYWHFALSIAQEWRKRQGLDIDETWERIINNLSPLTANDGVYAASENSPSYLSLKPAKKQNDGTPFEASELSDGIKLYSDHMAVLGACGVLPQSPQYDMQTMSATLEWVLNNWNWDKTWGWDFPTTCMTAVRTGHPDWAIDALLKDCRTNTYLPNGHNYQDSRLRCYLPGNGGLLTAVALMCAGWDGCCEKLPGFPHNGQWDVEFEGIEKMPGSTPLVWDDAAYKSIEGCIHAPVFANKEYVITHYGASTKASAKKNQTAINKAIADCSKKGGGSVIVPEGTWNTGAIRMLSNVNLCIRKGAVLQFVYDPSLYPMVQTRWEGMDLMNYQPCIYAYREKNIAISGGGIIDGGGTNETWWQWCGAKKYGFTQGVTPEAQNMPYGRELKEYTGATLTNRNMLLWMADNHIPVERRIFGKGCGMRPQLVNFFECSNILMEDVTLLRSPFWCITPTFCQNITIRRCSIINSGPNGDGCDPESCKDVLIEDCLFQTGDDCIAIKSGRNEDGRVNGIPSERIIIRRCKMKDGHGGVVLGSETSAGVHDVFAEDCEMDSPNLDRVLRIKTNTCRGGETKRIYMRNIKVGECREAVLRINLQYEPKEASARGYIPKVHDIYMENVTCGKSRYGVLLNGLDDISNIYNVHLKNCHFTGVTDQPIRRTGKSHNIVLEACTVNGIEPDTDNN